METQTCGEEEGGTVTSRRDLVVLCEGELERRNTPTSALLNNDGQICTNVTENTMAMAKTTDFTAIFQLNLQLITVVVCI